MLGFLYSGSGNVSPAGQPFEGLTGSESNTDASGNTVTVYQIDPTTAGAYFMPGADPGEGYANTNAQLFGTGAALFKIGQSGLPSRCDHAAAGSGLR